MQAADDARVPAGAALAVDRERFAEHVTRAVASHPLITISREEIQQIPVDEGVPVIVATGPLTSAALSSTSPPSSAAITCISTTRSVRSCWRTRSIGRRSSGRHDGGEVCARRPRRSAESERTAGPACGIDDGEGDYLNCPLDADEYSAFTRRVTTAEKAPLHEFDDPKFFEGCLPIEVMAARGVDTLRFGPMKPVGLTDPRTGREPYAVVQLRQDNLAGRHYSLVGFQTQMKWPEQARVLRHDSRAGAGGVRALRDGPPEHVHQWPDGAARNVADAPTGPNLFFAGQISGVEGYVESAASGLIAGRNAALLALNRPLRVPPRTTAIGALAYYVSHANPQELSADEHHLRDHGAADGIGRSPPAEEGRSQAGRTVSARSRRCSAGSARAPEEEHALPEIGR